MNFHEGLGKITVCVHPAVRGHFLDFYREIAKHPRLSHVRPFEIARSPEKQELELAAGNSKVGAWRSVHQYGCAVDFVPCPGGKWTWDFEHWEELHKLANEHGLDAPIPWDKPHIVAIGWRQELTAWLKRHGFT